MAPSTTPSGTLFPVGLDDLVASVRAQYKVPSQCIGVVDGDQADTRAYGYSHLPSTKATEDTLYYIASCTKSFTATTLLSVLCDLPKGTTTLQSKLIDILPPGDFALPHGTPHATETATLEDALTHRLGLARHDLSYGGDDKTYTVADAVRSLRHLNPLSEFRQKYHYCNMGYMTVQHAIETLGRERIEDLHARYIWGPLGMKSTVIRLADAAPERLAEGYTRSSEEPEKVIVAPHVDDYPLVGGGGMISSVRDMTLYIGAMVRGEFPGLDAAAQAELVRPRVVAGGEGKALHEGWSTQLYALGWKVATFYGHPVVYHDGGICGFAAKMVVLPRQRWGMVILANSDTGGTAANETVTLSLLRERLGLGEGPEGTRVFEQWEKEFRETIQKTESARERLYPNKAAHSVPLSLPLEAYEGVYRHPGYGTMTVRRTQDSDTVPCRDKIASVLHAEWPGRLMDFVFDFEHVAADEFVVWIDTPTLSAMNRSGQRGQFIVDGGKVKMMGVNLSPAENDSDDVRLMIWFDRVG